MSAISSATYVFGLGRYSDGWAFTDTLFSSPDQSFAGLYAALSATPYVAVRPLQILWFILFYKIAPHNWHLAHIANHLLFAAATLVMYFRLRRIPAINRRAAYSIAILYLCLPTFSATKVWYANHQATLGLLFCVLALSSTTRLRQHRDARAWPGLAAIALFGALSNLSYELFALPIVCMPLFAWLGWQDDWRSVLRDRRMWAASGAAMAAIAGTTLLKLTYHFGVSVPDSPVQFAGKAIMLYLRAGKTMFWALGAELPWEGARLMGSRFLAARAVWATLAVLAVMAFREICAARLGSNAEQDERPRLAFMAFAGAAAFVLGYVPYLPNFLYNLRPWGEPNRGNIGGAIGAALIFVSLFLLLRERWPRLATAGFLGFCALGVLFQTAVGVMWDRSAREQDQMLAEIHGSVGALRPGESLLVYGTCPYYGAGPVFPYGWDLANRLHVDGEEPGPATDMIRKNGRLTPQALQMNMYPKTTISIPYKSLVVFDRLDQSVTRVNSYAEAHAYFRAHPFARAETCNYEIEFGEPLF